MQACEGDLTLQFTLYGVQGELHIGWWESLAPIIWSLLLPVPGREARGQDRDWMDHHSILHRAGLGSHTIHCSECHTLSFVEELKDWMLPVILHWKLRHWWPWWSSQKAKCCDRWLCWMLGKSVLPPWNPSECWPRSPCVIPRKVSFFFSCLGGSLFCKKNNLSRLIKNFVPIL